MSIINIKNVSFKYQEDTPYVIDGLSLTVEKGEFICVLGKNGSGKSTLAKLINGMLLPTEGDISVFDMDVKDKNSIFGDSTPLLPQKNALLQQKTAYFSGKSAGS